MTSVWLPLHLVNLVSLHRTLLLFLPTLLVKSLVISQICDSFNPEDRSGRVLQRFEGEGGFADVGSTIDDAELENIRSILARPEGLEFLRQNFQGIFADPAVEALIREILPAEAGRLFDQERPSNVTRFDPVTFEGDTSRGSEQGAPITPEVEAAVAEAEQAQDEVVQSVFRFSSRTESGFRQSVKQHRIGRRCDKIA